MRTIYFRLLSLIIFRCADRRNEQSLPSFWRNHHSNNHRKYCPGTTHSESITLSSFHRQSLSGWFFLSVFWASSDKSVWTFGAKFWLSPNTFSFSFQYLLKLMFIHYIVELWLNYVMFVNCIRFFKQKTPCFTRSLNFMQFLLFFLFLLFF